MDISNNNNCDFCYNLLYSMVYYGKSCNRETAQKGFVTQRHKDCSYRPHWCKFVEDSMTFDTDLSIIPYSSTYK